MGLVERNRLGRRMVTWEAVTPDFDLFTEEHDGRVWLHNRVYRWSARVLREVRREVDTIQKRRGCDLWVLDNDPEKTPLLPRYLLLFGFTPCEFYAHDGRIRTAFKKRLH